MRCKPGISAFVIVSRCGNEGRVVEVGAFVQKGFVQPDGYVSISDGWFCTGRLLMSDGSEHYYDVYPDHHLLPINGGETKKQSIEAMRLLTEVPQGVTV